MSATKPLVPYPSLDPFATSPSPGTHASRRRCLVFALWGLCIVAGVGQLTRYHVTPTAAAQATPPFSKGQTALAPWKLVMALHPLCPCSRASLHELGRLRERWDDRLIITIIFAWPELLETDDELWRTAAAIPGATLYRDVDGSLARDLDAKSSGQTYFYDPAGKLRFSGGITVSRGHRGDNVGSAAIGRMLMNEGVTTENAFPSTDAVVTAPVFGCSLD